jgi:vanillate O-demethylase ferredoxin subunit
METFQARLHAIVLEADGIATFEFRLAGGGELPRFSAGAHIDVHIAPGCVRQYSLCNDPRERHRYVVAVLREESGRGGSKAMHDELRVGQSVTLGAPRNFFPLARDARRHLLIAGGIGVTPMLAMTAQLQSQQSEFFLHYCTRSPERTAFRERVEALADAGRAAIHHDGGEPSRGLDLAALLRQHEAGTHVYYCGPAGFMQAAGAAAAHWPPGSVHAEHFTAPVAGAAPPPQAPSSAFRIRLARSGLDLEVPADKSIVDVLREHDVFIETSCTQGYCGTCLTRYVAGEPEHRDTVLDDDDRKVFVLVCCARARTPTLELDL